MRTIAHISDVHFGTENPAVVEGLLSDLKTIGPHLVAVSGDLTQRARRSEFAAARAFLERIPFPKLIVPGNHDIPLYDVGRRFLRPLHRFRRYITPDLAPLYVDDEIAALGINTARSATWKNGRISLDQIRNLRTSLCPLPPHLFRVIVTHHPFLPPPNLPRTALVGRGPLALQMLQSCGADLLLAGHLHLGYTGDMRSYDVKVTRSILVAQAGTAVSTRIRGEANAYNLITLESSTVTIDVREWDGSKFRSKVATRYSKIGDEWKIDL